MVYTSRLNNKKILITGKTSRFCKFLFEDLRNYKTIFTDKKNFNILKFSKMEKFIKNKKIDYLIHIAGLSRPMAVHDKNINSSIDLNILGTANVVKLCEKYNIKLIYFSTNYVYPCKKGSYKETDPLLPINNYAWSKLGGECAVQMYKNSLILRLCMTDYPFVHKKAVKGAKSSFIFNKSVSKILPYLINELGVINVGGKSRDILSFAQKNSDAKIGSISIKKVKNFPKNSSINISKLKKILSKKKKLKELIF